MRVFLISGARLDEKALGSYLIPSGTTGRLGPSCDLCIYNAHEDPYDFLVEGYEDLVEFDSSVTAFLPQTPPLISSRTHIDLLASSLTGVVPVRVGFNEWEQSPVPEADWFSVGPRLGALFVRSVCQTVLDECGVPLEKCPHCGRQRIRWYQAEEKISQYAIKGSEWPGTDLFVLEGGGQHRGVCLTDAALEKTTRLGFDNLHLVEMRFVP